MSKYKEIQEYIDQRMRSGRGVASSALMVVFKCDCRHAQAAMYTYRNMYPERCLAKSTKNTLYPKKRFTQNVYKSPLERLRKSSESFKFQEIKYDYKLLAYASCTPPLQSEEFMLADREGRA